ncbi:MAG: RraA family protein [Candidatus Dormibacteraceae bacterium]
MLATAQVVQGGGARVHLVRGLLQMTSNTRICAPAVTCRCMPGDNLALHVALARAPAGSVLVCDAGGDVHWGYFGELMGTDARNRGLAGLIIDGSVRDVDDLGRLGFPVFARATAPAQAKKLAIGSVGQPIELSGQRVEPGDQLIADRDAIAVVRAADWMAVRGTAEEIARHEAGVQQRLKSGERLAEIIGLKLPD